MENFQELFTNNVFSVPGSSDERLFRKFSLEKNIVEKHTNLFKMYLVVYRL